MGAGGMLGPFGDRDLILFCVANVTYIAIRDGVSGVQLPSGTRTDGQESKARNMWAIKC